VVANVWSLGLQDSNKRKMTVRADGEVFPLTKEDLKTTELKRWPDFDFFIGGDEPGAGCQSLLLDLVCVGLVSKSSTPISLLFIRSQKDRHKLFLYWTQMAACQRIYRSGPHAS
jgi:hypothetical protein